MSNIESNRITDKQAQDALAILENLVKTSFLQGEALQQAEDAVETINLFIIENETY